ncbi:MAG: hypothetical protein AAGK97_11035, partial [Bacteroidota bacterium]
MAPGGSGSEMVRVNKRNRALAKANKKHYLKRKNSLNKYVNKELSFNWNKFAPKSKEEINSIKSQIRKDRRRELLKDL